MTEIVQANPPNASLRQHGQKDSMVEVVRVENFTVRGPKNQFFRTVVLAPQIGLQEPFVSKLDQYSSEFPRQIHSSPLLAFCRCVFTAHVVVLHQDEAFGIIIGGAELNVSPLYGHQVATTPSGAKCHKQ